MKNNTQKEKIKKLFEDHPHQWIPCYEVARFSLQYNARVLELRRSGMEIKNQWKAVGEEHHSWFMYVPFKYNNGQGEFL